MIENTDTELIGEPPKKDARETLYHCTSHLLYALLSEADEDEKQALYRSLEHLGIAQIHSLECQHQRFDPSRCWLIPNDRSKRT